MIQPEIKTGDLLLSIIKNSETLFKQTHRKAEETLDFKLSNQEKYSISIHPFRLKKIGC